MVGLGGQKASRVWEGLPLCCLPGKADLVTAYRAARILTCLRSCSQDPVHQVLHLALGEACCDAEEAQRVVDEVGRERLDMIRSEVPDDLLEAINLLEEHGIEFSVRALEREVIAGKLPFTIELSLCGVREPQVVRERLQKGRELIAPFEADIRQLVDAAAAALDLDPHACEWFLKNMRKRVLDGLAKGVTEHPFLLGHSFLECGNEFIAETTPSLEALLFGDTFSERAHMWARLLHGELGGRFPLPLTAKEWASVLWASFRRRESPRTVACRLRGGKRYEQLMRERKSFWKLPVRDIEAELED